MPVLKDEVLAPGVPLQGCLKAQPQPAAVSQDRLQEITQE